MRTAPLLALLTVAASGCGLAQRAAVGLVYDRAPLADSLVTRDVAYLPDGGPKHRLNLFRPAPGTTTPGAIVPTVVFVHGGGWTTGDRDEARGGADFYNNVGRFLAGRGIATAVVSYRFLPGVGWRDQLADVAAATAWAQRHAPDWGGAPGSVVVMGHSAGGQLAARVALDAQARREAGAFPVCGAVVASGAALDLVDPATWETGTRFGYYAERFSPERRPLPGPPAEPYGWQTEASPVTYVTPDAPPFLISVASGEAALFKTQAAALGRALDAAGVPYETVETPALTHALGVPNLSRDDRVVAPAAARFVQGLACGSVRGLVRGR